MTCQKETALIALYVDSVCRLQEGDIPDYEASDLVYIESDFSRSESMYHLVQSHVECIAGVLRRSELSYLLAGFDVDTISVWSALMVFVQTLFRRSSRQDKLECEKQLSLNHSINETQLYSLMIDNIFPKETTGTTQCLLFPKTHVHGDIYCYLPDGLIDAITRDEYCMPGSTIESIQKEPLWPLNSSFDTMPLTSMLYYVPRYMFQRSQQSFNEWLDMVAPEME